jgi:predicted transposase/invertase (TIGR01784 family)
MRRGIEIGRQEGRQEGEQISCRKVAKKMMQEGLDIKTIIKVTGVKIEELK